MIAANRNDFHSPANEAVGVEHDDDSTVSYYENTSLYVFELNHLLLNQYERRRSFESCTTEDDSTVSTIALSFYDDVFEEESLASAQFVVQGDVAEAMVIDTGNLSSNSRKVKFGTVSTREYGVTVGSRTASSLSKCPLELTWEYAESDTTQLIETQCDHRLRRRAAILRPLSVDERRERIALVQGISLDDVAQLEYEASLLLIQESIASLENKRRNLLHKIDSPTDDLCTTAIVCQSNPIVRKIMLKEIPSIPL